MRIRLALSGGRRGTTPAAPAPGSLEFFSNGGGADDYASLLTLPPTFGEGEFTFEIWFRLDETRSVGDGSTGSQTVWANNNPTRYSSASWWYAGNFLIDGHNNNNVSNGTFSLQIINANSTAGADLRWTYGDGSAAAARTGGLHAAQSSGLQLRDGNWHHAACVRRWSGASDAALELWVDGVLVGSETATASRTDMGTYWDAWSGYPAGESGWFLGAEKISALGGADWSDFVGEVAELRFYAFAKQSSLLTDNWEQDVHADAPLVGHYKVTPLSSNRTYDAVVGTRYIEVFPQSGQAFSTQRPPAPAASTLASTVTGMSPNTFTSFGGSNLNASGGTHPTLGTTIPYLLYDGRTSGTAFQVLGYCGKGCFDPVNLRALFMGCGASNGSWQNDASGAYQVNTRPIFSAPGNAWSVDRAFRGAGEATTQPAIGHMYDGNAIDVSGRRLYKARNDTADIYVYDLDTGAMLATIAGPAALNTSLGVHGLEFVPTRGSSGALWLLSHNTSNQLICWELQIGGSWTTLFTNAQLGSEGNTSNGPTISYNPRGDGGNGAVLLAGSSGQWIAEGLSGTPTLTSIARPNSRPLDCANGESSGVCRDPVGDGWLKFSDVANFVYRWSGSASGGSWSQRAALNANVAGDFIVIPIDALGAVWIIRYDDATFDFDGVLYRSGD